MYYKILYALSFVPVIFLFRIIGYKSSFIDLYLIYIKYFASIVRFILLPLQSVGAFYLKNKRGKFDFLPLFGLFIVYGFGQYSFHGSGRIYNFIYYLFGNQDFGGVHIITYFIQLFLGLFLYIGIKYIFNRKYF